MSLYPPLDVVKVNLFVCFYCADKLADGFDFGLYANLSVVRACSSKKGKKPSSRKRQTPLAAPSSSSPSAPKKLKTSIGEVVNEIPTETDFEVCWRIAEAGRGLYRKR